MSSAKQWIKNTTPHPRFKASSLGGSAGCRSPIYPDQPVQPGFPTPTQQRPHEPPEKLRKHSMGVSKIIPGEGLIRLHIEAGKKN